MTPRIVRPQLGKDKRDELATFLCDHWKRTEDSRLGQLEKYSNWEKLYRGIPAEEVRNVPWYKSSNYVVKLVRIFLDTFVARTLNIIYATKPLLLVDGFPTEVKESLELYLNRKAQYDWKMYCLTKDLLFRGNKNGTVLVKSPFVEDRTIVVTAGQGGEAYNEEEVTLYSGPRNYIIPFEDFAIYPVTANYLHERGTIKFHKVRFVEEEAKRRIAEGKLQLTLEELESALKVPVDAKRLADQEDAGVIDPFIRELHTIECHHDWEMNGRYYSLISTIEPSASKLVDCYFNPNPNNWNIFNEYRPFPREDFFYGESMCELLDQSQEEVSQIHNDRRNNSFVSNAPVFKRRSGSLLPNPSTNWYPGKVFDVDDMADFDVVTVGRNYNDTLAEEQYDLQLAERLSGIGSPAQGYAGGMMGKRGIYNATGTLALLSESNQRQDTNIRDVRESLSDIAKTNLALQAAFGADDPLIATFPTSVQEQVRQALQLATPTRLRYSKLEVKASSAANNQEVERQNLMQLASIVNNYGGAVQQMAAQLLNPQLNPGLRLLMNDVIKMMRWSAARLLRAFNEFDAEELLPNVAAAIEATLPGGSRGTKEANPLTGGTGAINGAAGAPVDALSREGLDTLLNLPPAPQEDVG